MHQINPQEDAFALSKGARKALLALLWKQFRSTGLLWISFWKLCARPVRKLYEKRLKSVFHKADLFSLRIQKRFSRRNKRVAYRFAMIGKFFVEAWHVVRNGYRSHPEASFPARLGYAMNAFGRGLRCNSRFLLHILNYIMPITAITAFGFLISYVLGLNYAVSVEYNGEHVGYVQDESVFADAADHLQSRMIYQDDDEVLSSVPAFSIAVVDSAEIVESPQLTDTIIRSSGSDIVQATGIKVDGKFLGAVKDASELKNALSDILARHQTSADERAEFTKNIQLESGLFLSTNLTDETSLISTLTSNVEQNVYHTVVAGDSPSKIAEEYDMTLESLVNLNPGILNSCVVGQQVLVNQAEPYLPVKTIRVETYDEPIAYSTVYVDSSNLYEGQTQTVSAGVNGTKKVTAEVSYVEGVESSRTVLSESVSAQPVAAKVARGTMKMMVASGYENASKSSAGLIWPTYGGYISQTYGSTRYESWHNGIDYATSYGTPIVSVLPGTVEFAGWRGTYGNLVIVNHGNGIKTWYAHCSSILVRQGDTVAQGQQIARVGSTGRSSGNHVHFRVLVNGVERNPLNYLP